MKTATCGKFSLCRHCAMRERREQRRTPFEKNSVDALLESLTKGAKSLGEESCPSHVLRGDVLAHIYV
jgi:hypothetical protein